MMLSYNIVGSFLLKQLNTLIEQSPLYNIAVKNVLQIISPGVYIESFVNQ